MMVPENQVAAATPRRPSPIGWIVASLSLSMLLPSLGTSVANVALPTLAQSFGASFQQVQWVVLAYLLATTALVVGAGKLGDLLGRRRLLVGGVLLFTLASVACAAASQLWMLIAARAVQGAGAAVMMALTMAFVGQTVPKARTGSAMGLLGTMSAVGTALGPSLGGVLIATFGWQAIFLVNLPLGLAAIVLALRHLPKDPPRTSKALEGFDALGTVLLAATLGAYALAVTTGRGQFGAANLALLVAALVGVAAFLRVESRASSPLVQLALFKEGTLGAGVVMSALVSTVMMATLVVGPFYLAIALRLDTATIGLAMSVGPLVAAFTGAPAGRAVDRFGAGRMTSAGLLGMSVGCMALALVPAGFGVAGYVAPLVVVTASYALFQAANNTAVMADVTQAQRGVVSGWLNLSRNLGLVTGASVMGAIFVAAVGTPDLAGAAVQPVAFGMHVTFAAAAALTLVALGVSWRSQARPPHPKAADGRRV